MSFIHHLKEKGKRALEKDWDQVFETITLHVSRRALWMFGRLKVPDHTSSGLKILCLWLSFCLSTALTPTKSVAYC